MTSTSDNHELLALLDNGKTIKRRPGEHIRISLGVEDRYGHWRSEPERGGAVRRIKSQARKNRRSGPLEFNYLYEAIGAGQSTIQIVYRNRGVITKVFTLTVQVVPDAVQPPSESVYVIQKVRCRPMSDSREGDWETPGVFLGVACTPERVEQLITAMYPGATVKWKEDGSARVGIQNPLRTDDVYIEVKLTPLHR